MSNSKSTTKAPIKWGDKDTCQIQGTPYLRANARFREFKKENPEAIFDSTPYWGQAGDYAVRVELIVGDKCWSSACADNLHKNTKPHLSAILETRARSRAIALFSSRYTLDGEMATADDVIDAQKLEARQANKSNPEAEYEAKRLKLMEQMKTMRSANAVRKFFASMPKTYQDDLELQGLGRQLATSFEVEQEVKDE